MTTPRIEYKDGLITLSPCPRCGNREQHYIGDVSRLNQNIPIVAGEIVKVKTRCGARDIEYSRSIWMQTAAYISIAVPAETK